MENLNTFDNRQLYKKLAKIALPIALQGVIAGALGLVDNLMVGFLGENELAAVGIAMQIFFIHYLFIFGFVGGTATYMAQFFGAKDKENIRKVIGFSITVTTLAACVFFIIGYFYTDYYLDVYTANPVIKALAAKYVKIGSWTFFQLGLSFPLEMGLKSVQQTRVPMIISVIAFSSNTFLNYCLIFGKFGFPFMGVEGAALATVIARGMEMVMSLGFVFTKGCYFRGKLKSYFGWNKELIVKLAKNAAPTTINELLWSMGQSMFVAAFARIGTSAYAGFQAATAINNIFAFASFCVGDATLILIGEKLGEGNREHAYVLGKKLIKVGLVTGLSIGALIIITAVPFTSLFKLTDVGLASARGILFVYGSMMVLNQYNGIQVTGILRAGGDTKFAMISESACVWFIGVPLAFLGSVYLSLPIYLAVLLVRVNELVKCVILTLRFRTKKWLNVLVD